MLEAHFDIRLFGPRASMTSRNQGFVRFGTTPRGHMASGLEVGGYHEQTPVTRYSEMMESTKASCSGVSKQDFRLGASRGDPS